jgi:uncharacterized protein YbjT (DUF2867 family)
MKLLLTGATGTAGSEVLNQALLDPSIERVIVLTRKPLQVEHQKLSTVIHTDFLHYDEVKDSIALCDACIWCLGISQSQVTKEQYHVITYDYAVAAADAFWKLHPTGTLVFLSGAGADSNEKSRTLFARVKGKAENALIKMNGAHLVVARPGGIKPVRLNPNTSWMNKAMVPLFPIMEWLVPNLVTPATTLAKAMIQCIKKKPEQTILENKDLKQIAADA